MSDRPKLKLSDFGFQPTGGAADSARLADFGFQPTSAAPGQPAAPEHVLRAYEPPATQMATAETPRATVLGVPYMEPEGLAGRLALSPLKGAYSLTGPFAAQPAAWAAQKLGAPAGIQEALAVLAETPELGPPESTAEGIARGGLELGGMVAGWPVSALGGMAGGGRVAALRLLQRLAPQAGRGVKAAAGTAGAFQAMGAGGLVSKATTPGEDVTAADVAGAAVPGVEVGRFAKAVGETPERMVEAAYGFQEGERRGETPAGERGHAAVMEATPAVFAGMGLKTGLKGAGRRVAIEQIIREKGVPTRAQEIRGYSRPIGPEGPAVERGEAPGRQDIQRRPEAKPEARVRPVQEAPKAAKVGKPKPPVDELAESHPNPEARKAAFDIVKQTTRRYSGWMHEVNANVRKWTKALKEPQRKDVGALIEGIGNLDRKGDTFEAVQARATPEMRKLVKEYRHKQERLRQEVNKLVQSAEGTPEFLKYVTDYLAHFYTGSRKKLGQTYTKWRKETPHSKRRVFPTYQEAVEAGFKPVTQDFAYLYQRAAENNVRAAVTRHAMAKLKTLSKLAEAKGQTPLLSPNLDKAGQGYVKIEHPVLRRVYARKTKDGKLILGEGSVWAHPDLVRPIKVLLDSPLRGPVWGAIRAVNSLGKSINVAFSLFHEIALYESSQAALARSWNPVRGFFIGPFESRRLGLGFRPRPTYKAGQLLDTKDPLGIREAIESGLGLNRSAAADYARTYLQGVLRKTEALAQDVPGLGWATRQVRRSYDWYQRHLWDNTHVGLKMFSYHTLAREILPRLPAGISERHAREQIASQLNDAFGGQEFLEVPTFRKGRGVAMEPMTSKEQQIAHALAFAPDWTWSNIRVAGRTLINFRDPVARKLGLRYWRNMTLNLAVQATLLQRAIHALFPGDEDHKPYPWQNEPGRKWDIDVTPLERSVKRALEMDPGKERHYVHMGKQAREVLRYFSDFPRGLLQNIGNKSSVGVRLLAEQFTGYQLGGSYPMPWMDAGFRDGLRGWAELTARAKAVGEHFIPFSWSPTNFAFAVPRRKGMTPYRAMRGFQQALELHADPKGRAGAAKQLIADIRDAAKINGIKPERIKKLYQSARSKVRSKYYGFYFDAWEDKQLEDVDKYGAILKKLGAGRREVKAAGKRRREKRP